MPGRRLRPNPSRLATVAVALALAAGAAATSVAGSVAATATPHPAANQHPSATRDGASLARSGGAVVATRRTHLGTILVTGSGITLYLFEKDGHNVSHCDAACASAWPPYMTSGNPKARGKAKSGKLGSIKRGSGRQVTYAGHPLYSYFADSKPGQTNGEGSDSYGARWYAVKPSGGAA